jgi:hypothetical protein
MAFSPSDQKKQFIDGPLEGGTALPSLRKGYASIAALP